MFYVGVDLHKASATFSARDPEGKVIVAEKCATSKRSLAKMFRSLPKPFVLGFEATYNWYFFADLAESHAQRVCLGHPYSIKAFAKRHKKTDYIDADLISWLLWKDVFPLVHLTSRDGRRVKDLIRSYCALIGDRSRTIQRMRAFADRHGREEIDEVSLTTLKGIHRTRLMRWTEEEKEVVTDHLDQIEFITRKIYERRASMRKTVYRDEDMACMVTIPGFDIIAAFIVRSEIDDVARFPNAASFVAYCGLAPNTIESAGKQTRGRLMKNASRHLKWIFIQNAAIFARTYKKAGERWHEKAKRTNNIKARLEVARLLCRIVYAVLREKRAFRQ